MKIFITGGTGFIGRHLVKALAGAGRVLYLLVRDKKQANFLNNDDNIVLVEGEIQQVEAYRQIFAERLDLVYHLAALSGQKWGADESAYYRINVLGTANLLEVCRGKIGRFIFCSSINAVSQNGFRRDPYGKSKWQAEQLVAAAGLAGLETVTLRPAVVYGPGGLEGMILKLCQLVQRGKFFRIGSGKNVIPLVYVDDLVAALTLAGTAPVSGKAVTYEIIGPDRPTLGEIVDLLARNLGVEPRRLSVPIPAARLAAFLAEVIFGILQREPLITQQRLDAILKHRPHLNSQKAGRELGYAPRVPLAEGIATTIAWFRQQGYLN
jgi:nucleoside-diphosphate-sugar epimerase